MRGVSSRVRPRRGDDPPPRHALVLPLPRPAPRRSGPRRHRGVRRLSPQGLRARPARSHQAVHRRDPQEARERAACVLRPVPQAGVLRRVPCRPQEARGREDQQAGHSRGSQVQGLEDQARPALPRAEGLVRVVPRLALVPALPQDRHAASVRLAEEAQPRGRGAQGGLQRLPHGPAVLPGVPPRPRQAARAGRGQLHAVPQGDEAEAADEDQEQGLRRARRALQGRQALRWPQGPAVPLRRVPHRVRARDRRWRFCGDARPEPPERGPRRAPVLRLPRCSGLPQRTHRQVSRRRALPALPPRAAALTRRAPRVRRAAPGGHLVELLGRRIRPLDAALWIVGALVAVVAVWLGAALVTDRLSAGGDSPVTREIAALEDLVRKEPANDVARLQLAQALSIAGREDEAVTHYRAVLQEDPENVTALSGLGFIASTRKQWETAEGYWQRIITLLEQTEGSGQNQALETAYFYMGDVLLEQKRYAEAIPYYRAALRIKRSSADVHYHLAVAYRETGSPTKYREELEAALAFDPVMPEANYDYGNILLAEGDRATAAEHFRASVDAAPGIEAPVEALEALGPAEDRIAAAQRLRETDPKAALVEARIAAALEPSDVAAWALCAGLYEKTGDVERALQMWKRVVALDGQNAEANEAVRRLSGAK
ncbi:MAG: tetratricopeptide repeat protein [Actinobacteria bacterium]|nr:MAG: tetratricopeptide repeat protein [Actinomycetota bacterium]